MKERSVAHATFTLERLFDSSPARVFAAWADERSKRSWFVEGDGKDWEALEYGLEFRVGGRERGRFKFNGGSVEGGPVKGAVFENESVYLDIVPARRIVFAYRMSMDEAPISASLGTVDIAASGAGAKLVYTEQAVFLDGLDEPDRRQGGWGSLLERLAAVLAREAG